MTKEQLEYFINQLHIIKSKNNGYVPVNSGQTVFMGESYVSEISSVDYKANILSFYISKNIDQYRNFKTEAVYKIDFNYEKCTLDYIHEKETWRMTDDWDWDLDGGTLIEKGTLSLSKEEIDILFSTLHDEKQIEYNKDELLFQQKLELYEQRCETEPYVIFVENYQTSKEEISTENPDIEKEQLMSRALRISCVLQGYHSPAFCMICNNEITLFKKQKNESDYIKKDNTDYTVKEYIPYKTIPVEHEDFNISDPIFLPINKEECTLFYLDKEHFTIHQDKIVYDSPLLYQAVIPAEIDVTDHEIYVKFTVNLRKELKDFLDKYTHVQSKLDEFYEDITYFDLNIEEEECILELFYDKENGISFTFNLYFTHVNEFNDDYRETFYTNYEDEDFSLSQDEVLVLLDKICHTLEKEDSKDALEKIQYIKNVMEEIQTLEVEEPEI